MYKYDTVKLSALYDFARKHRDNEQKALDISGSSSLGKEYCQKAKRIVSGVSEKSGVYLWGFYNSRRFWVNVYIGKEDLRKTANLKDRLYKELTAERACVWREVLNKQELHDAGKKIHPTMWYKYRNHWERALRKAGSTHVFWVATPDLRQGELEFVEDDLIEAMNPTGNRRRRSPPRTFHRQTGEVFEIFRKMIHSEENRNSQFPLKYHNEFWKWLGESDAKA
jgi:hypothetical protein